MIAKLKQWFAQIGAPKKKTESKQNAPSSDYFTTAQSWADDLVTATVTSRNRYKLAFFAATGLAALMTICVMVLVPAQHTELVVVHVGQSGYTWLTTTKSHEKLKPSWAEVQSNIARYITARESYDPILYRHQTSEVKMFSASDVEGQYILEQSQENKNAPINVLQNKGYRTVVVNNVMQEDLAAKNVDGKGHHVNLAQVNFVVVDHLFDQSQTIKTPYTALVSWRYDGIPSTPEKQLRNWNGFTVTKYQVQPVNSGT